MIKWSVFNLSNLRVTPLKAACIFYSRSILTSWIFPKVHFLITSLSSINDNLASMRSLSFCISYSTLSNLIDRSLNNWSISVLTLLIFTKNELLVLPISFSTVSFRILSFLSFIRNFFTMHSPFLLFSLINSLIILPYGSPAVLNNLIASFKGIGMLFQESTSIWEFNSLSAV